jgi:deferrochelatase/peroxidase EfeB
MTKSKRTKEYTEDTKITELSPDDLFLLVSVLTTDELLEQVKDLSHKEMVELIQKVNLHGRQLRSNVGLHLGYIDIISNLEHKQMLLIVSLIIMTTVSLILVLGFF